MTIYKTVEVQIDLSDFSTEALLQELVDRRCPTEGPTRSWLLEMLSPNLESLLVEMYEEMRLMHLTRGIEITQSQDRRLSKLFDITLGRIL